MLFVIVRILQASNMSDDDDERRRHYVYEVSSTPVTYAFSVPQGTLLVDPSDDTKIIPKNLVSGGPDWRHATHGLNLEGK